jgi:hypothetical protein
MQFLTLRNDLSPARQLPYSTFGHVNISVPVQSSPPVHLNLTLPSLQSGSTLPRTPLSLALRTSAVAPGSSRAASSSLLRRSWAAGEAAVCRSTAACSWASPVRPARGIEPGSVPEWSVPQSGRISHPRRSPPHISGGPLRRQYGGHPMEPRQSASGALLGWPALGSQGRGQRTCTLPRS